MVSAWYTEFNFFTDDGQCHPVFNCVISASNGGEALAWAEGKKKMFENPKPEGVGKNAELKVFMKGLDDYINHLYVKGIELGD